MKRIPVMFLFVVTSVAFLQAQTNLSVKGTVTRMRMTECVLQRGFVAAMSGAPAPLGATCPEYTLANDKVVYEVVGRHGDEFMPLAEDVHFQIHKSELVVFSDDEKAKSHFVIKQMTLRADWDREQESRDLAVKMLAEERVNRETRDAALSYSLNTK